MKFFHFLACLFVAAATLQSSLAQEAGEWTTPALNSPRIITREGFAVLAGAEKHRQLVELSSSKQEGPLTPDDVREILGPDKTEEFHRIVSHWTLGEAETPYRLQSLMHDHLVQALKNRTLEETIASLHLRGGIDEDAINVAEARGLGPDRFLSGDLYSINSIADIRVARIYEHLKQLPREEAAQKCQELFEQNLKALSDGLETWFGLAKLPPAERQPIGRHDHALRCTVLLSAMFSDSQTLLKQIDRWKTGNLLFKGRAMLRTEHRGPVLDFVTRYGEPDQLFLAHVIMINLQQQGRLTPEILAQAHKLGLPEERVVSMIKWDAPDNIYDRSRLVPLDGDDPRLERNFTVTHYWGARAYNSLDMQDNVVACLRGVLSQPAGAPQDPQPAPAVPKN